MEDLFTSKKFIVSILASIIAFYGVMNNWTPEQLTAVIGPLATYILGQGLADLGKEAKKIDSPNHGPSISD
jgi:hypothetical protein